MTQFSRINTLQINNHLWVFTGPQIIEYKRDENSITMQAVVIVDHEIHLTKDVSGLEELSVFNELPKQPGWYWVTSKYLDDSIQPFAVEVRELADGLVVWQTGDNMPEELSSYNWIEQIPQKVLEHE